MLWSLLENASREHAARTAVRDGAVALDYRELAQHAAGLALALRARGIAPGDRIAILARNRWEFVAAYLGAAAAGAILVPWNTRLTAAEHAAVLAHCGASLVLVERDLADSVRALEAPLLLLEDWPALCTDLAAFVPATTARDSVAQLYYTSGTTGAPKGVMLTHGNVASHAALAAHELTLCASDVWGHIAPLFHLADAWATFAVTARGGTHAFVARFSPDEALAAIARDRITITNLVPTMLNLMVASPAAHDTSSLRAILSGGAPIAPEVVGAVVARFRCEYVQTYGLTETSPLLTMSLLDDELRALPEREQLRWRSKTGRAVRGVELRVVGADGADVPCDGKTVGEIRARGPTVTPGYWQDEAATRAAFDGGWFKTGDLAVVDERRFVTIVDRAKDVIKTGGEAVYSIEVENRLYEHPAVLEAAVFGVPDPLWGERVTAAIVTRAGASVDAAELIAFCRARLAGFKAPREVRFVAALPRTGSGKIAKRELRARP